MHMLDYTPPQGILSSRVQLDVFVQPTAHYLDGFKDPFGHGGERNEATSVVVSLLLGQHGGVEPYKTFGFAARLALISREPEI